MIEHSPNTIRLLKDVDGDEVDQAYQDLMFECVIEIHKSQITHLSRDVAIEGFLRQAGWGEAARTPLAQDASTRRYERLTIKDKSWLLMDAPLVEDPPCPIDADESERLSLGWNATTRLASSRVEAFVAISGYLRSLGLSAPDVYAYDKTLGLAIVEDFGSGRELARMIEEEPRLEETYYWNAVHALAVVHKSGLPDQVEGFGETWPIQRFDRLALTTQCNLFADWFPQIDPNMAKINSDDQGWQDVRDELIDEALTFPRTFTLRDYHAENLIWLPRRPGVKKIGMLDFQDAIIGWDAWDISMLVQDVRRDVKPWPARVATRYYLDEMGVSQDEFDRRLTIVGTLNMFRILGIFSRLCVRDKKTRYKNWLGTPQRYIAFNLRHFKNANDWLTKVAPRMVENGFL